MNNVNVLVATRIFSEAELKKIREVDPRVQLKYAANLLDAEIGRIRRKESPGAEESELDSLLADTEILVTLRVPPNLLSRAPGLKWFQSCGTGVDHLVGTGILEKVIVTNASGTSAISIAEHSLTFMLMLAKQIPTFYDAQNRREWTRDTGIQSKSLYGQTLGIIGLGSIGGKLANLARVFGMRILVYDPYAPESMTARIQATPVSLSELLKQSDFVSIHAPLTDETRHMISEDQFRMMKPSAFFINIARGEIADEQALISALKEGWIAGAGLDVFESEPLAPDSELWQMPNVIITPHLGGGSRQLVNDLLVELVCKNLARYLAGDPLFNVLDSNGMRTSWDDPFS